MRVICSKENLLNGINIVQKAISNKPTLQILEGIMLEVSGNFKMTGNDLEIGIECYIESDIQRPGSIVINSKMFGDIVRRLPDSEVLIEVKENNLVIIECENSHFEVKGLPSSGYPAIPEIVKENAFNISQKILRDAIRQTIFAVSVDENRPILTGALIECADNEINFVSIDGFRLALRKSTIENNNAKFSVVVPGKTLNEISKIIQQVDNQINIYNSGSQILFDMGNCKVVSGLIEGEYLHYRSIIPKEYETTVILYTEEILRSIERASLITMDDKRYPVKLSIEDEKMIITSNTDIGTVREEVNIEMEGKKIDVGFNPRYFIDALKAIEDEKIKINFTTNVGPCTLCPEEGAGFNYMILPVRTRNND